MSDEDKLKKIFCPLTKTCCRKDCGWFYIDKFKAEYNCVMQSIGRN